MSSSPDFDKFANYVLGRALCESASSTEAFRSRSWFRTDRRFKITSPQRGSVRELARELAILIQDVELTRVNAETLRIYKNSVLESDEYVENLALESVESNVVNEAATIVNRVVNMEMFEKTRSAFHKTTVNDTILRLALMSAAKDLLIARERDIRSRFEIKAREEELASLRRRVQMQDTELIALDRVVARCHHAVGATLGVDVIEKRFKP